MSDRLKAAWPPGQGVFLLLLFGYVALFFFLRLALSGTAGTDDVEQVIFAQNFDWGYNPGQPPLYTWLLYGLFELFGPGIHTLSLLRYSLVFLTFFFLFLSLRRLLSDPRLVLLASFSPLLIYYVGWGMHVGFTHTALLSAACMATFYAFLRLVEGGSWPAYLGFGLALGIGMMSKYSFPIFALGLIGAGLIQEKSRDRLLSVRFLVSLALALAVNLPPVLWIIASFDSFQAIFQRGMRVGVEANYLQQVWFGLSRLVMASVEFLMPLLVFLVLLFPQVIRLPVRRTEGAVFDCERLLGHFFVIVYGLLVAGVLFAGISFFQNRWMHPFLLLFPVFYFLRLERAGLKPGQARRFAGVLVVGTLLAAIFWVAQAKIGAPLCKKCRFYEPYPALAQSIADAGFVRGTIVSADEHIGGNFRLAFPDSRVINVPYAYYSPPENAVPGQCLYVWNARDGLAPPGSLAAVLSEKLSVAAQPATMTRVVEAQNPAARDRTLRLAFVLLPSGEGRCR